MAMDARTRSSLYEALRPVIGDDNANALVTQFPTIEADELVTRQILRAEMAELRSEMHDMGRRIVMWNTGSILAGIGLTATIVSLLG